MIEVTTVSASMLAKLLDVNPLTIYRWGKEGLPYEENASGRYKYNIDEVQKWLLKNKSNRYNKG